MLLSTSHDPVFILSHVSDVCQGVQGACPQQAVTSTEVMAEHSKHYDIGTGLKLVSISFEMSPIMLNSSEIGASIK